MGKARKVLATGAMIGGLVLGTAGAAGAAPDYNPNVTRIANPATVCKSIPGSVAYANSLLGINAQLADFTYSDCVRMLAKGDAFVEPAEVFGSPYAQCKTLLSAPGDEGITLPYVFHNGEGLEDQILPDLKANNIKQCGSALYAFHAIFEAVGPELPTPPE